MHTVRLGLAVVGALVALALPTVAQANEVTKWNELAVSTVNAQPPLISASHAGSIFMAMVQGAVYGAVNAVDRHGKPYLVERSFPKASADAAAATAAYRVLGGLFGTTTALDNAYAASLLGIPNGASKDQGIQVGEMAAAGMLAEGHDTHVAIGCTFGTGLVGVWEPLAGATGAPACDPAPWIRDAKPFVVESASQFRTAGPYPFDSAAYAADLNEIKSVGASNSTTRSIFQTHAAAFWQSNPAANYNAIARRLADQFSLDVSDSARLFALLDLSAADALINAWNDKYHWNFWRPITAIHKADIDGNAATDRDTSWKPLFDVSVTDPALIGAGALLPTPPYPEHPSGATSYASASMHALASFFGTDELTFYATSSRFPGEHRVFNRFSDLTNEVVNARVWAGIHFRNADNQAADLGAEVENYVLTHQFAFVR